MAVIRSVPRDGVITPTDSGNHHDPVSSLTATQPMEGLWGSQVLSHPSLLPTNSRARSADMLSAVTLACSLQGPGGDRSLTQKPPHE
jgi:hypothetical protein